ncbi:RICIN domain-containing protein [Pseudomonas sp. SWRI102]|uniref:RICIN domain-containing protein n=1 Tax=Pseudomonas marvdashtae TaxID=2745500 RepID=A0A923FTK9_9PSED|nr:RICIN domain-containing protein [Pseudomonas marvdashtae]MBV4552389.1 RICIN domain-containing protein [Pseudomonas marvdashtae]
MNDDATPREDEVPLETVQGAPGPVVTVDERYIYRIYSCLNPAVKLVDMSHQSTPNGMHNVKLFSSTTDKASQWRFTERTNDGYYLILNQRDENLALGEASDDSVIASKLTRSRGQYWILKEVGNGYFFFENKYDGLVMDVAGANTADNTNICVYRHHAQGSSAHQQFKLARV